MASTTSLRMPGRVGSRFPERSVHSKAARQHSRAASRVQASSTAYEAPSSAPAASELAALSRFSVLVPDTLLLEASPSPPKAATVSFGLLRGVLRSEQLGERPIKNAITSALNYDKCAVLKPGDKINCQVDKALVNVGALFAEKVEGRVCTEVDPSLSKDQDAIVAKVHSLLELYQDMNVPRNKLIFRIPGTWNGIRAAAVLEKEGIATQVFLVYSYLQGVAAAQAGVSVIQPNVGRVRDWYNKYPNMPRDPSGPREDSGFSSRVDPGVTLVKELYSYVHAYHPGSAIMASGIRSKEDALALSGCDYLILSPRVMEALAAAPTIQGYNDGLVGALGTASVSDGVERALGGSASEPPQKLPAVDAAAFEEGLGLVGAELLRAGLAGLHADMDAVLPFFQDMVVGAE